MISSKFSKTLFLYDLLQLVGKSSANQISAAVFVKITNGGNMEPDGHQFVRENISEEHYFRISLKKPCKYNIQVFVQAHQTTLKV